MPVISRSVATVAESASMVLSCDHLFPSRWNGNESPAAASLFKDGTVVLLNSPDMIPSFFSQLWTSDKFRVCADGAANRFDLFFSSPFLWSLLIVLDRLYSLQQRDATVLSPHVIVGDFDSAKPAVLRHFESLGVVVVRRPSQDSTDLQKVLA